MNRHTKQFRGKFSSQSGFSLIEALVAFLILSIGMLGIASLQNLSLSSGHTARLRSIAVIKVEEAIERMRGNPAALADYDQAGAANGCSDGAAAANDCTPAQLAQDDIQEFADNLTVGMPAGTTAAVTITDPVPPATLSNITFSITWQQRDDDSAVDGQVSKTYTTTVQM